MFDKREYQAAFSKVTASEETHRRIMHMTENTKRNPKPRNWLGRAAVVAAVLATLTVTASASEVVRNWFVSFFAGVSEEILTQEQVDFIEENEHHIDNSQTKGEWTIKLRSAIADGMKGYILLSVTAPEYVSLEDLPVESKSNYYGPGNDFLPKSEDTALSCSAYPDINGVIANIGTSWQEDGDGLTNTVNYVIDVAPDVEWADGDPFGSDALWHIHIVNLVQGFPEQRILAEGTWDFDFTFEKNDTKIELLAEPRKVQAWANLPDGTELQTDVTAVSITLRPFGATIYYGDESDGVDYSRTYINFTDSMSSRAPWFAVMKDGRKIELYTAGGNPNERYMYLESKLPIIFENVDYLLLSDGSRIPMPE